MSKLYWASQYSQHFKKLSDFQKYPQFHLGIDLFPKYYLVLDLQLVSQNWIFFTKELFSEKNWFWEINCSLKTRQNFGKRSMPIWNWGHFWKSNRFLKCWEYWEAEDSLLKMSVYLVSLYWGPEVYAPNCMYLLNFLVFEKVLILDTFQILKEAT